MTLNSLSPKPANWQAFKSTRDWIDRFFHSRWIVVAIVLGWLAFSTPSLLTYPAVDSDETLFSSVGNYFYNNGSFLSPVRSLTGANHTAILHGRLYAVILGLSFQLFGIGVLAGRLVALTGCLLSGLLVLNIGRALNLSRPASLAALALFWTSWRTLFASHSMRPEMWIVVGGLLAIYLHLRSRRTPTKVQYLILGFVTSYLLDFHVPAIFYSVVVGGLVGFDFLARRIGMKQLAAYLSGLGLGLAAWAALWILPDFTTRVGTGNRGPLAVTGPESIWQFQTVLTSMFQFGSWLLENFVKSSRVGGLEVAFFVAAILVLVWRRTLAGKYLLSCMGLLMLALLVTPYRHSQHAVLVIPLTSLIVACAADSVASLRANPRSLFAFLLVVPLLGLYITGGVSLSWRSRSISYADYASALRQFIPPGSNVLGEDVWWFEFHDGDYGSDISLPSMKYSGDDLYNTRLESFKTRQVDYVLVDERIGSSWQEPLPTDEANFSPIYQRLLKDYCQNVGVVDLPYIGVERGGPANKRTTIWHCSFGP